MCCPSSSCLRTHVHPMPATYAMCHEGESIHAKELPLPAGDGGTRSGCAGWRWSGARSWRTERPGCGRVCALAAGMGDRNAALQAAILEAEARISDVLRQKRGGQAKRGAARPVPGASPHVLVPEMRCIGPAPYFWFCSQNHLQTCTACARATAVHMRQQPPTYVWMTKVCWHCGFTRKFL